MRLTHAASGALFLLLITSAAAAQGKKGSPPGHLKHPDPGDAASASPASSSIRSVYLGSWIDDASVLPPGKAWVSASMGYWHMSGTHIIDAPVIDMAVGASRRTQFGFSVPVYHVPEDFGPPTAGVGQYFFYGKISLIDPGTTLASTHTHSIGVAVSPLVEVTSSVFEVDGRQHVSWAAPVNVEVRTGTTRVYGSVGYFSRGALFGAAALDVPVSETVTLTPSVGHTFATSADAGAGSRHRTDLSLTTSRSVRQQAAIFGSVGESIAGSPAAGEPRSVLWFAAGVAVTIK